MSRLTEMCRCLALAAALLVVPLAAQSQAAGGFLGAGAGSRSAAAAMGMGADVDPAAAAMMGGGTSGMGIDTSGMQGLGGQPNGDMPGATAHIEHAFAPGQTGCSNQALQIGATGMHRASGVIGGHCAKLLLDGLID